jgi:hypothetical protein
MINKYPALTLVSVALAFSWPAIVLAQQSKVIELVATDKGSKIATIHLNDQDLLFEPSNNSESFLFTGEALFAINHKDKTYSVQSYEDLLAVASRKAGEIAKSQETPGSGPDVELRLTGEVDTIAGLKAHKIIKMNRGRPEAEIWVCRDLVPVKLRAAGERIRSVLPKDYWRKVQGNPGLVEMIMLYGIPVKIVNDGQSVYQPRVIEGSRAGVTFQVPSGYRKVGN